MAGRAGRRGLDDKGTVIYVPARTPVSGQIFYDMVFGKRASVVSKFTMSRIFVLQFIL
jgi:superfamily II RNA helicase